MLSFNEFKEQLMEATTKFKISDKKTEKEFGWKEAQEYVNSLGQGWRLPTKNELDRIYKSNNDFSNNFYWSSTPGGAIGAWGQDFDDGVQDTRNKRESNYVRAIKD